MILLVFAFSAAEAAPPPSSSTEARRTLHDYAMCTVKHRRIAATTAVVEDWPPAMMSKRGLITSDCLNEGMMQTFPLSLLSAFGEALAVTDKDELPPAQVATAPELAIRQPEYPPKLKAQELAEEVEENRVYDTEQQLGECVVHQDPSDARALLGTRIGAKDEEVAARTLVPALSHCVQAGVTIELTPEVIREAVGVAYYRMEMAVRGTIWRP
jgi:hypothetical protein